MPRRFVVSGPWAHDAPASRASRLTSASPGTVVLARIASIFGPGEDADMTYFESASGAKVFAAGVMNFGGSALWPYVCTMIANVWRRLSGP